MDFYHVLDQIIDLLRQRGRTSYRALKRQFDLDDDYLEDLKVEIIKVQQLAVDQDGEMLVWTGDPAPPSQEAGPGTEAEGRFYALLQAVIGRLRDERRVTYRELKHAFGIDDALREAIRQELRFKRLAIEEDGEGLVWTGEAQPERQTAVAPRYASVSPEVATVTTPVPSIDTSTTVTALEAPAPEASFTHLVRTSVPEPSRSISEAKRRQQTVMFCDLADSTKLSISGTRASDLIRWAAVYARHDTIT